MERTATQPTEVKNLSLPQSIQPKTQSLEDFKGLLSDEEILAAAKVALDIKEGKKKLAEYNQKIADLSYPKPSTEKFYNEIIAEAKKEIPGFFLTTEEDNIYKFLAMYFTNNPEFEMVEGYSLKKGLLLFGNIGCGKTTALELFQSNPRQSYVLMSCRDVANGFNKAKKGGYEAIEKFYGFLPSDMPKFSYGQKYLTFCFDDLGTETSGNFFGNESNVMAEIFLSRYQRKIETHISTNLTIDEIDTNYGRRVRDRFKEMFNVISFPETAQSKRK